MTVKARRETTVRSGPNGVSSDDGCQENREPIRQLDEEEKFPHELSTLLFDFAEQLFAMFPPNENQPRNLFTAYLECVLYLVARMDLLLQYLDVADDEKERVIRVILSQIEDEFGTVNPTTVTEVVSERMAQYDRLFTSREAFSERWYDRVFAFYATQMDEAMDENRRFIWNITRDAEGTRLMSREDILETIRLTEVEQVVTFQRVIINFFTHPEESQ